MNNNKTFESRFNITKDEMSNRFIQLVDEIDLDRYSDKRNAMKRYNKLVYVVMEEYMEKLGLLNDVDIYDDVEEENDPAMVLTYAAADGYEKLFRLIKS